MDEKKLLRTALELYDSCGDIFLEAELLTERIIALERALGQLFNELNPIDSSWVDSETWFMFKQQVIDYCEGAK
jgi:hypothetical protein